MKGIVCFIANKYGFLSTELSYINKNEDLYFEKTFNISIGTPVTFKLNKKIAQVVKVEDFLSLNNQESLNLLYSLSNASFNAKKRKHIPPINKSLVNLISLWIGSNIKKNDVFWISGLIKTHLSNIVFGDAVRLNHIFFWKIFFLKAGFIPSKDISSQLVESILNQFEKALDLDAIFALNNLDSLYKVIKHLKGDVYAKKILLKSLMLNKNLLCKIKFDNAYKQFTMFKAISTRSILIDILGINAFERRKGLFKLEDLTQAFHSFQKVGAISFDEMSYLFKEYVLLKKRRISDKKKALKFISQQEDGLFKTFELSQDIFEALGFKDRFTVFFYDSLLPIWIKEIEVDINRLGWGRHKTAISLLVKITYHVNISQDTKNISLEFFKKMAQEAPQEFISLNMGAVHKLRILSNLKQDNNYLISTEDALDLISFIEDEIKDVIAEASKDKTIEEFFHYLIRIIFSKHLLDYEKESLEQKNNVSISLESVLKSMSFDDIELALKWNNNKFQVDFEHGPKRFDRDQTRCLIARGGELAALKSLEKMHIYDRIRDVAITQTKKDFNSWGIDLELWKKCDLQAEIGNGGWGNIKKICIDVKTARKSIRGTESEFTISDISKYFSHDHDAEILFAVYAPMIEYLILHPNGSLECSGGIMDKIKKRNAKEELFYEMKGFLDPSELEEAYQSIKNNNLFSNIVTGFYAPKFKKESMLPSQLFSMSKYLRKFDIANNINDEILHYCETLRSQRGDLWIIENFGSMSINVLNLSPPLNLTKGKKNALYVFCNIINAFKSFSSTSLYVATIYTFAYCLKNGDIEFSDLLAYCNNESFFTICDKSLVGLVKKLHKINDYVKDNEFVIKEDIQRFKISPKGILRMVNLNGDKITLFSYCGGKDIKDFKAFCGKSFLNISENKICTNCKYLICDKCFLCYKDCDVYKDRISLIRFDILLSQLIEQSQKNPILFEDLERLLKNPSQVNFETMEQYEKRCGYTSLYPDLFRKILNLSDFFNGRLINHYNKEKKTISLDNES